MQCYKVVLKNKFGYRSAIVSSKRYLLYYRIGEEVKPNIGRIYVFKNLYWARTFARQYRGRVILLCECGDLEKESTVGYETSRWQSIKDWWEKYAGKLRYGRSAPDESYSTEWVKPIREMERREVLQSCPQYSK